jgi:CubicO group peptidase (beta-lactamase class C family)
VVRKEGAGEPLAFGCLDPSDPARRLTPDALFLVASLTKPVVAMAALKLVEEGRLSLNDKVHEFLPAFDAANKRPITIRHLLTHTSGLPDMLPNNRALRQSQAPLSAFVSGACAVTLDYPCGRGMQYQSMGYALLGEVIARVSGLPCGEFLKRELFAPLGLNDTELGAPPEWLEEGSRYAGRIASVRVPEEQVGGDEWNWNSRYWRSLGAPWGGMLSTASELGTFLRMMLNEGRIGDQTLFAPSTITAATTNQLASFADVPESDRRARGWGFGWRLNWTAHAAPFGDLLPTEAYGHWGATGTLWWADPTRGAGLVLLSTQPTQRDRSDLLRLSNAIAASIVK